MNGVVPDVVRSTPLNRAEVAFRRAVQMELEAIRHHEQIAAALDLMAAAQERSATRDGTGAWSAMAVRTRLRARAIRQRADDARARLRSEGVQL
jgi:hypothetical protein